MVLKTKIMGREALTKRLRELAPKAIEAMDKTKMEVAQEAAAAIAARAPKSPDGGDYAASIKAEFQSDHADKVVFGGRKSKDPTAVGIYGNYIWRFLEFGTKASLGTAPRRDRRYKKREVMTQGKGPHAATPAQPHVFPVWRGMRKKALSQIRRALNKGVREAMGKK
ncbi:HK97 gp10 family phage protein [Paenochrobactrum sp. BZR 588]|uniref:HK97 gp10 family phage protein n=1 Tax=unclassified Paenochrobactrum TaxID=2639760 RepID=UPI003852D944